VVDCGLKHLEHAVECAGNFDFRSGEGFVLRVSRVSSAELAASIEFELIAPLVVAQPAAAPRRHGVPGLAELGAMRQESRAR
jgi:hypothetical protein